MNTTIIIILSLLVAALLVKNFISTDKDKKKTAKSEQDIFDYTKGYNAKWLFSYNEKDAYKKIKAVTDELNMVLFAKVRLLDLIEPKNDIEKKQGHLFKIQAKHVDFVICDNKLVARAVIELDDNSHDTQKRQERDAFVDTVLANCGYKILHTRNIEPEQIKELLTKDQLPSGI